MNRYEVSFANGHVIGARATDRVGAICEALKNYPECSGIDVVYVDKVDENGNKVYDTRIRLCKSERGLHCGEKSKSTDPICPVHEINCAWVNKFKYCYVDTRKIKIG